MTDYCVYIEKLRTPKNGGEPYWDRKPYEDAFIYKSLPGDVVNRLGNVVRRIDDESRLIIVKNTLCDRVSCKTTCVDVNLRESPSDIADALCSVVNAVLELKNAVLLSVSCSYDKFIVKYRVNGEERRVVQPLR